MHLDGPPAENHLQGSAHPHIQVIAAPYVPYVPTGSVHILTFSHVDLNPVDLNPFDLNIFEPMT